MSDKNKIVYRGPTTPAAASAKSSVTPTPWSIGDRRCWILSVTQSSPSATMRSPRVSATSRTSTITVRGVVRWVTTAETTDEMWRQMCLGLWHGLQPPNRRWSRTGS